MSRDRRATVAPRSFFVLMWHFHVKDVCGFLCHGELKRIARLAGAARKIPVIIVGRPDAG